MPAFKNWIGSSINRNMTYGPNWLGGSAPVAYDFLIFNSSDSFSSLPIINDFPAATDFAYIEFGVNAPAFTLNGNSIFMSNAVSAIRATIRNFSNNTQTINLNIILANMNVSYAICSINVVTTTGDLIINGDISGASDLILQSYPSTRRVIINGKISCSGGIHNITDIQQGTIIISNALSTLRHVDIQSDATFVCSAISAKSLNVTYGCTLALGNTSTFNTGSAPIPSYHDEHPEWPNVWFSGVPGSLSQYVVNINGTNCDKIKSDGTVWLATTYQPILNLNSAVNTMKDQTYNIIEADLLTTQGGSTPYFNGLPDGSTFSKFGRNWRINYTSKRAYLTDISLGNPDLVPLMSNF